jgi:hypothetical protein
MIAQRLTPQTGLLRSHLASIATLTAVALLASAVQAGPASAVQTPGGEDARSLVVDAPPTIAESASDAVWLAIEQANVGDQLVSFDVDSDAKLVTLFVGVEGSAVIEKIAHTFNGRRGVSVVVKRTEINEELLLSVLRATAASVPKGTSVSLTSAQSGYTEIEMYVSGDFAQDVKASVRTTAERAAHGVPVAVTYLPPGRGVVSAVGGGRAADTSPFRGGAVISSFYGSYAKICSTGMRVKRSSDGAYRMLTANHCANASHTDSWYSQSTVDPAKSGWYLGTSTSSYSSAQDAMLLKVASGKSFSNSIYTGSYYATTHRDVVAGWTPGTGTTAYLSGGWRGQATTTVLEDNFAYLDENYNPRIGVLYVTNSGYATNGEGDSGSPFYRVHSNGVDAIGVGLLSGMIGGMPGAYQEPCSHQGPPESMMGSMCGNYFVGPKINSVESALAVSVE